MDCQVLRLDDVAFGGHVTLIRIIVHGIRATSKHAVPLIRRQYHLFLHCYLIIIIIIIEFTSKKINAWCFVQSWLKVAVVRHVHCLLIAHSFNVTTIQTAVRVSHLGILRQLLLRGKWLLRLLLVCRVDHLEIIRLFKIMIHRIEVESDLLIILWCTVWLKIRHGVIFYIDARHA